MNFSILRGTKRQVVLLLICIAGISTFWEMNISVLRLWNKVCGSENLTAANNTWFMQRFNQSFRPLLSRDNNISPEEYSWWKKLQSEWRDFDFYTKTTASLLQLLPDRPEPQSHQCRRCAVVGNSGNLLRSHYGKLINQHDFVFRINLGRTKGFEEDVGNKTTHRVMYPESATVLEPSTHLVFFPFKIRDLEWLVSKFTPRSDAQSNPSVKTQTFANKNLAMVVSPAFIKYVHESWLDRKGQYPSTGFMVVILALHLCDQVSVFGFGADSDGNWSHYWEVLRNKKLRTGPHPGSAEYDMILELAQRGRLHFYRGW